MIEIKFNFKGEETVAKFYQMQFPKSIEVQKGFKGNDGVDLTAYPVIYATFGRHGGDKAWELHLRTPECIIVYAYEWTCGSGEGVILPENFDPSKLSFFKSSDQMAEEAEREEERIAQILCYEIKNEIRGVRVSIARHRKAIEIGPAEQEVFCDDWATYASSVEEAKIEAEKMIPFWREWNERVLSVFQTLGYEKPEKGNTQIVFTNSNNVKIIAYPKVVGKYIGKKVIYLEKREGNWEVKS